MRKTVSGLSYEANQIQFIMGSIIITAPPTQRSACTAAPPKYNWGGQKGSFFQSIVATWSLYRPGSPIRTWGPVEILVW